MARPPERTEHNLFDARPCVDNRADQPRVREAIAVQLGGRRLDRSVDEAARPVIEWMRQHRRGLDPFEPV